MRDAGRSKNEATLSKNDAGREGAHLRRVVRNSGTNRTIGLQKKGPSRVKGRYPLTVPQASRACQRAFLKACHPASADEK